MPKLSKKIVLTGGHAATTALATIEALRKQKNVNWDISWIGTSRAVEGQNTITLEFKIFPKHGVVCHEIISGRLQKKFSRHSLISLARVPAGFIHGLWLVAKLRPEVVLSFGGFAAFPVVVGAWILRIPVILHEQTIAIGLANKISAPFATKIAVSRPESKKYFPAKKTELVGNPLSPYVMAQKPKTKISSPPVIFVTGGSRGSRTVNDVVLDSLGSLLENYVLVHQCGDLDFERCRQKAQGLPEKLKSRYELHSTISPFDIGKVYSKADIIVGRAGANTVAEIMALKRPAVLIPISWSRYNEQYKNAWLAEKNGLAVVLDERELNKKLFLRAIAKMERKHGSITNSPLNRTSKLDLSAAEKLSGLAFELAR